MYVPAVGHTYQAKPSCPCYNYFTGADLGYIKGGGGLTQGTNLLGRGVRSTLPSMQSMLELGGSGGMLPQENFEK